MKKHRKLICGLAGVIAAIPLVADLFGVGTIDQYLYNAAYLFIIMPACIHFSGILGEMHPELFPGHGQNDD